MGTSDAGETPNIKLVVQSVQSAELTNVAAIGPGLVVYISFLAGCTLEALPKQVASLLSMRLCPTYPENGASLGPSLSLMQCNRDILLIPQACVGGKLKGKSMQYHGLVDKDLGRELFEAFVAQVRSQYTLGQVHAGIFGNMQALQMKSHGPFTHILEL
jgi:D-aminoacyl-tRNA deacylase